MIQAAIKESGNVSQTGTKEVNSRSFRMIKPYEKQQVYKTTTILHAVRAEEHMGGVEALDHLPFVFD